LVVNFREVRLEVGDVAGLFADALLLEIAVELIVNDPKAWIVFLGRSEAYLSSVRMQFALGDETHVLLQLND
jgi:hypothetical protein